MDSSSSPPDMAAEWQCCVLNNAIKVSHKSDLAFLYIRFQRTIRVPDNTDVNDLPPGTCVFPLSKIKDYAHRSPKHMVDSGGLFFPMYQREAMWISFEAYRPFMIRIIAGDVNVVSGEHKQEDLDARLRRLKRHIEGKSIQDYIVAPRQPWIDGFASSSGTVRQFVAMPLGQGYSVEAQMTGQETVGGLRFEITPVKLDSLRTMSRPVINITVSSRFIGKLPITINSEATVDKLKLVIQDRVGIPCHEQRIITHDGRPLEGSMLCDHAIQTGDNLYLLLRQFGGGPGNPPLSENSMSFAAGGKIKQVIRQDILAPDLWNKNITFTIPVHILNSTEYHRVTGTVPPPSPITAAQYAAAGLPFFQMDEEDSDVFAGLQDIKSINEIDNERGHAKGAEATTSQKLVRLDKHGRRVIHQSREKARDSVLDPDGLLDLITPLPEVRSLSELTDDVKLMERQMEEMSSPSNAGHVKIEIE